MAEIERQQEGAGMGTFSHIERTVYQPVSRDTRMSPVFECAVVAVSQGVFVALIGSGAALAGGWLGLVQPENVGPICALSALAGVVKVGLELADNMQAAFETYRTMPVSQEIYKRESQAAAQHSEERITLESYEKHGSAVTAYYDALECSEETLRLAVSLDAVSVRSLQGLGLAFDKAKSLLAGLSRAGFVQYPAPNKAAIWTEKAGPMLKHYRQPALEVGGEVESE